MNAFKIATDGLLGNTFEIAVRGLLSTGQEKPKGGGIGRVVHRYTDEYDDHEVLLIAAAFTSILNKRF